MYGAVADYTWTYVALPSETDRLVFQVKSTKSDLCRDGESVVGFFIFPITYLALSALVVRGRMPMSSFADNAERRELHFAASFEIIILATLLASLGHVAILGWMRTKCAQLPRGRFLVQQVITAVSV